MTQTDMLTRVFRTTLSRCRWLTIRVVRWICTACRRVYTDIVAIVCLVCEEIMHGSDNKAWNDVNGNLAAESKFSSRKICCGIFLTLLLSLITFAIILHVWIGILVNTGLNRGDISKLTGEIKTKCTKPNQTGKQHEISRLIHQIWNDKNIPEQFIQARESCKKLNPDYEYRLWTPSERRNLFVENYPWFLEMYDGYSQEIMRINAARYFIVYHYGGMYLDIDMACKVPFDKMFKNASAQAPDTGVMLGGTIPTGCGTAWIFARKHHPFMELVTKRLLTEYRWYVLPYWTNTISTGVIYMWRTYLNYPCREQVFLVDPDIQNNVYFNHLHFSSWHKWDAPLIMFFDFVVKHLSIQGLFFFIVILFCFYVLYNNLYGNGLRWKGMRLIPCCRPRLT